MKVKGNQKKNGISNTNTWRLTQRGENVKFVGLLEEQVDDMNCGDKDHKGAQEQIAVLVENQKLQFRFSVFFPFFVCITHPCSSSPVKLKSVKMSFTIIIIIFKNYHSILVTFTTLCPTFIFSRISSERVLSCIAYTVMCSWIWHGLFPLCSRGHINWWSVSTGYCVHD